MTRLALLAALALAACDSTAELECLNPEAGVAEVGAGDLTTGFIELEDGDEVRVVLGPQGLHMIVVSGRARDFEMPREAQIHVEVGVRAGGEIVGGTVANVEPSSFSDGAVELLGLRAVFTVAEVRPLDGQLADVELIVVDGCDRRLESTQRVRLAM